MNIIIPMAGRGTRLRPHTLTVPKPLIPIAGKPIVQRLVEEIGSAGNQKIDEIAFIIGDFGEAVEKQLIEIAERLGAKGSIHYQDEPLGTAHAILCAESALHGNVVIAFADTLFKADFRLDTNAEGVIWVKQVEDPSAFGVVKLNGESEIVEFVEKPDTYVSDLAIIGIYYINDGEKLKSELRYLIDNDIKDKGEYQLTNALENMKNKGCKFLAGEVSDWMDCGNKNATVDTNTRILELNSDGKFVADSAELVDTVIIEPCYIGENTKIANSIVGPNVSVESGTQILNCVIKNSMLQKETLIANKVIDNSMIGSHVTLEGRAEDLSVGDYTVQK